MAISDAKRGYLGIGLAAGAEASPTSDCSRRDAARIEGNLPVARSRIVERGSTLATLVNERPYCRKPGIVEAPPAQSSPGGASITGLAAGAGAPSPPPSGL